MNPRSDYLVAASVSTGIHVLALVLTLQQVPRKEGPVALSPAAPMTVLSLDARLARELLEPSLLHPAPALREATIEELPETSAAWPADPLPRPIAREIRSLLVKVPLPRPGLPLAGAVERLHPFQPIDVTPSNTAPDNSTATTKARPEPREPESEGRSTLASGLPDLGRAEDLLSLRTPIAYPERARRLGIEGITVVGIEIQSDGRVQRTWLIQSSGSRLLDRAALAGLCRWRFDPAAVSAAAVGRRFRQDVRFRLN